MNTAILIDDDVAVLEYLRSMIPWEACGFQLSGAFTNAYDALEQCKTSTPELIITDIGMPGMDGMELIKAVKEIDAHSRFIILSCHDEFRYAQQAVQLGVQDYILKETLDAQEIVKILLIVTEKLEEENRLQHAVQKLHFQVHRNKSAMKEKWLRDLFETPEDPLWTEQLEEFGLRPILPSFIPVVGRLHLLRAAMIRYKTEDTVKFIVENAVEELLKDEPNSLFFSYSAKEFCLLYNCRNELKVNPHEKVALLCKDIQQRLTQVLKLPISMVSGQIESNRLGVKRQLATLIQEAEQLFYAREPEFLKASQSSYAKTEPEDMLGYYFEYAEKLNRIILEGTADASMAVDPFIDFITTKKFPFDTVKQFVFKLVLDMMIKLKFNQQYTNEKVLKELEQLGNVIELREWLLVFVQEAMHLMEQISRQSKKSEIVSAKKYVNLHIHQKITLEEVADYLHLNPSYFSRLFKKETGENFIEYVKRMKMEKAKEWLVDTGKTVDEVSQLLGYDNKGYFVKLFKQHFGKIPSQYV